MPRLPRALTPFRTGQYRILAIAITMSLLGMGVWLIAGLYQVIDLGLGAVEFSALMAVSSLGMLLFVLVGGVAADRVPQRSILLVVEAVKAVAVAALAVLALTGTIAFWHLVVVAFVIAIGDAFFYPAYSAMLPSILPPGDLLAANGFEGVLRPAVMQAAGPALASAAIAVHSPGLGFVLFAAAQVLAVLGLLALRPTPVQRDLSTETAHPIRSALGDIGEGVRYMVRTPWLFATLLFASAMILVIMGPMEVLLPFAVREQTGGGAGSYAAVLAGFGAGGAIGSLLVASLPLPRRYLTVMILLWGFGCVPFAAIGFTDQLWVMIVGAALVGLTFSAAQVIWGTLLQRRVPPHMLGRVSSLDFFVSLVLMPVSMALAGPLGEGVGIAPVFIVAGLVPVPLAILAVLLPRLGRDEIAHPLDPAPPGEAGLAQAGDDPPAGTPVSR